MKAQKHDNASLEELRALSSSEVKVYVVLLVLSGLERRMVRHSLSELSELSGLSTGTVSRAVGTLCRKGHISYEAGDNQHRTGVFHMDKPVAELRFGVAQRENEGAEESLTQAKDRGCSAKKEEGAPISNRAFLKFDTDTDAGKQEDVSKTREEALALEVARAFDDMEGIGLYLDYCRRYPERLIRRAYGEVKALPDHVIRRSRGALFNYLVQKYAKEEAEQADTGA